MATNEIRPRVIRLYKTLLYMGRDYPKGYEWFRDRCHNAFMKNKDVRDPEKLKTLLNHGEFVRKEIEALYYLKKYRTLKHRYYEEPEQVDAYRKLEESVDKVQGQEAPRTP